MFAGTLFKANSCHLNVKILMPETFQEIRKLGIY
jgi:hypothetical protein